MTYASVNGLQLYYDTRGTGRPLVQASWRWSSVRGC